jgi:acyl carrier protein
MIENREMEIITDQLTTIFRKIFNDETIFLNSETTAKDIGSWDSLSHMLMITEVENIFSIKFKLREINKLKNVGTLIELIESKLT